MTLLGAGTKILTYAGFDELRAGNVIVRSTPPRTTSRFAVREGTGYFAWHSTNEIKIQPLAGGSASTLRLATHDGWIHGLDKLGDGSLVVATSIAGKPVLQVGREVSTRGRDARVVTSIAAAGACVPQRVVSIGFLTL